MKVNCKELAEYSSGEPTIEGRLHHKRITGNFSQSGFKEKWFKLRANVLFYFNSNENHQTYDKKPAGAFVLENAVVQHEMNSETPFSFSILFPDELDRKHLFSGRTDEYINQWVNCLKQASYEFWRSQLITLQTKLCMLTGKDPLLMYPRNEGSSSNCTDRSIDSYHKSKKQCASFRSYVTSEDESKTSKNALEVPDESPFRTTRDEIFINGLDLIGSEFKSLQINPPPSPPRRPARANRLKHDDSSPNLIEL